MTERTTTVLVFVLLGVIALALIGEWVVLDDLAKRPPISFPVLPK